MVEDEPMQKISSARLLCCHNNCCLKTMPEAQAGHCWCIPQHLMSLARLFVWTPVGTGIVFLKPFPLCHTPGLEVGQPCPGAILCPSAGCTSSPVPLPLHRDRTPFCSSIWRCGETCTQSHERFNRRHGVTPRFYCWVRIGLSGIILVGAYLRKDVVCAFSITTAVFLG